jgi:hypothetical protein
MDGLHEHGHGRGSRAGGRRPARGRDFLEAEVPSRATDGKENGQIRQSNTARTVGNVGSHPPSRILGFQPVQRLPPTSVQG